MGYAKNLEIIMHPNIILPNEEEENENEEDLTFYDLIN